MAGKKKTSRETDPFITVWGPDFERDTIALHAIAKTPTRAVALIGAYFMASLAIASGGGGAADNDGWWGKQTRLGARLWRSLADDLVRAKMLFRDGDGWMTPMAHRELSRRRAKHSDTNSEARAGDAPSNDDPRTDETSNAADPHTSDDRLNDDSTTSDARLARENQETANENNDGVLSEYSSPFPSAPLPPPSNSSQCSTSLTAGRVSPWAIELVLQHMENPTVVEKVARDVAGQRNVGDIDAVFRKRMNRDYHVTITDIVWNAARLRAMEAAA